MRYLCIYIYNRFYEEGSYNMSSLFILRQKNEKKKLLVISQNLNNFKYIFLRMEKGKLNLYFQKQKIINAFLFSEEISHILFLSLSVTC